MKKILGISAFYHDSSASVIYGDEIIAAAQEERFTRIKHDSNFPTNAIKYCLEESGFSINELDAIVFYEKPILKFERLLETYYAFAPKGITSFLKAIPIWVSEKIFLKKLIYNGLREVENFNKKKLNLLFSEHHLSHSASTYYPSSFNESAILTIDGVGEWCTASICYGQKNKIKVLRELHFPHSVGLLYSCFTYFLGFKVNSGEYKLMGLAPYGNQNDQETINFIKLIKDNLVKINQDGSIWLDQKYYNYSTGLKMIKNRKWEKLFGLDLRKPEDQITQKHCNLALAIQKITEEIVIKMAREAKRLTGSKNLCLAGGAALNSVANGKLLKENIFEQIYIQPAAGDAGGSLGAALATNFIFYNQNRSVKAIDSMKGTFLGPSFSEKEVQSMNKRTKAVFLKYENFNQLIKDVAYKISKGNVVGWFQGRMEFGPRALGCRSILADARNPEMHKKLNLKIKNREGFRPLAPSVLAELSKNFFDLEVESPYMLFVSDVLEKRKEELSNDFQIKNLWDKLHTKKSDIPSVTHVDCSARVQTVHKETNLKYWSLINEFNKLTNYGLVINTSFNVRGEPIVCTPLDAFSCFMSTEIDYLVINDFVYEKSQQLDFENKEKWRVKFQMD
tara:strand:- start:8854 stop:10716 length:1863 start_codon:yes stop_codon:yes gene_type:complete